MPFWQAALPAIGQLFGGMAASRQQGREAEARALTEQERIRNANRLNLSQQVEQAALDRAKLNELAAMARANWGLDKGTLEVQQSQQDIAQRKFGLEAPMARAAQALRGDYLANAQPFSWSGLPSRISSRMGKATGGFTPEHFSAETRQLGQELSRAALMAQLAGDTFDPFSAIESPAGYQAPAGFERPTLQENQLPKAGILDSILGIGGMAAGLGGALLNARSQGQSPWGGMSQVPERLASTPIGGYLGLPEVAGLSPGMTDQQGSRLAMSMRPRMSRRPRLYDEEG